jgi:hypothetical protein
MIGKFSVLKEIIDTVQRYNYDNFGEKENSEPALDVILFIGMIFLHNFIE